MGADEVLRQEADGYEIALVAKRQGIVIPFSFPSRQVLLPNGDETVLEDEEVAAHISAIEDLLGKSGKSRC